MILLLLAAAHAREVSFTDAVRLAAGESPHAQMVVAQGAAAQADARVNAAWANPEIAVRQEPEQTGIEITVPLDIGTMARGGVVSDALKVAEVRAEAGRAAVGAAGGGAWLDAHRAGDIAMLAKQAEDLAVRLSATAMSRVTTGEWSADEGALVRADAARELDRALTWAQEAQNASARLAVILGVAPDDLTLGAWPQVPTPPALDAARLPTVIAADLDARIALGNLHAAQLSQIPTIQLNGGYLLRGAIGPTYGASITIPLFAPGFSRVQGATARSDGASASADLARLDAVATVKAAKAEMEIAERLAAAWDIPGLDAALDATARRYNAGELSLPDYIARRDLAVEARQNAIDARWRLARARLAIWELAGQLPPEGSP